MVQRIQLSFLLVALTASGQQYGLPPAPGLGATDLIATFRLPPLRDTADSPVEAIVSGLQVGKRGAALGLTGRSPIDAWTSAQMLLTTGTAAIANRSAAPGVPLVFSGGTASELNRMMAGAGAANIRVTSAVLTVDQPIEMQRSGVTLDLGTSQLTGASAQPYMLRIEHASNVTLLHGFFISGDSAILVNASAGITVSGVQIRDLKGSGILVTGSNHVQLIGNQISGIGLAGIMLHRGTAGSIVQGNQILGNLGASNMTAGIVVTDREVDLTSNPRAIFGADGYWVVAEPMMQRLNPPHDNVIVSNQVLRNSASGIYSDGAVRNVFASNTIQSNAKEGLCLDNGSTANVVASNVVEGNGERWGETDAILSLDFVQAAGRLADGTPVEKVPGISIDNALYNVVFANSVSRNYGGGIKVVRTGYLNIIGLNTVLDDNEGQSDRAHFFGMELGAAPGDDNSPELDFTPSRGNIVFSNSIRGAHYSGIFFDDDSDQNDILDNVIMDASNWALEAVKEMPNNTVDNLTNLPSRNVDTESSGAPPAPAAPAK